MMDHPFEWRATWTRPPTNEWCHVAPPAAHACLGRKEGLRHGARKEGNLRLRERQAPIYPCTRAAWVRTSQARKQPCKHHSLPPTALLGNLRCGQPATTAGLGAPGRRCCCMQHPRVLVWPCTPHSRFSQGQGPRPTWCTTPSRTAAIQCSCLQQGQQEQSRRTQCVSD